MSTIVAQSTPPIQSAIAIIRLSGEESLTLTRSLFSAFGDSVVPRKAYFGRLDTGKIKDDCVCIYFQAPHSYTGEDVVEIYCHGSIAVTRAIIERFIELGARMAERGEFTRRAFENGKMDLTESEAVIDLINAESEAEARSAYNQLSGSLSEKITLLQDEITVIIAKTEAAIDYPEEDIEELTEKQIKGEVAAFRDKLVELKNTYRSGRIMRDGVKVAIVGKPNAGKSKLMNALLGYERSIVTDIAGTTRDYVEESFIYRDMRFCLIDTAGIRDTDDTVEKIGVERSVNMMKSADIVLYVLEAGDTAEKTDVDNIIYAENKIDILTPELSDSIKISALTGEGLNSLKESLYTNALGLVCSDAGINNLRHLQAVENALQAVENAMSAIENKMPPDLVGDDLMNAYRALGHITGITSSDKIVGEIFSRFCVGK